MYPQIYPHQNDARPLCTHNHPDVREDRHGLLPGVRRNLALPALSRRVHIRNPPSGAVCPLKDSIPFLKPLAFFLRSTVSTILSQCSVSQRFVLCLFSTRLKLLLTCVKIQARWSGFLFDFFHSIKAVAAALTISFVSWCRLDFVRFTESETLHRSQCTPFFTRTRRARS